MTERCAAIGNDLFEISFDPSTGAVTGLKNRITGDDYMKVRVPTPLFKLRCRLGEQLMELAPSSAPVIAPSPLDIAGALQLDFGGPELRGVRATVLVTSRPGDPESLWSISLTNNGGDLTVIDVLFPYVRGFCLGDSWEDDVLLYPHHAGERTEAPAREYASQRFAGFWRAAVSRDPVDGAYWREINYCGLASMQWMYLHDNDNALFISSYDPDFLVTGLRVETGGPSDPWMGWGIRKHTAIPSGACWQSHQYGLAIMCDDWHWGARRYRRWFDSVISIRPNPDFLRHESVLNQCYNFKRNSVIQNRFTDIPRMFDEGINTYGMRHMFIASWNRSGFDQDYPEYHPDMELGSCLELAEGCDYVNRRGGFVTFYINSRIFHVKSDFFESLGIPWSMKTASGGMYHETYGPHEFVVLCPSHEAWQRRLIDTAVWMAKSYGATGIYLDQLGSAEPFACFDPEHSHTDTGLFNQGYMRVLDEVLSRIRAINPRAFLMIENCGDVYGSWVWGNLTWNGEDYDEFYNMYKYTFPEYVQVNMVNPRRNLTGAAREARLHADLNRALMLGSVLWLGMDKVPSLSDAERAYVNAAVALRAKLTPLYAAAEFADCDGIVACSPGVQAAAWRSPAVRRRGDSTAAPIADENTGTGADTPLPQAYVIVNSAGAPGAWIELAGTTAATAPRDFTLLGIDGTENRLTIAMGQPAFETIRVALPECEVCVLYRGLTL